MTTSEAAFSELINQPRDTIAKLCSSPGRHLRLRRRDAEDLVLTTATRAEEETEMSSASIRLLVALIRHDNASRELIREMLPEVFPWACFLPDEDAHAFTVELVETLRAADSLHNPAPAVQAIAAWRHTAEVHADPELRAALTSEHADHGPVEPPAT